MRAQLGSVSRLKSGEPKTRYALAVIAIRRGTTSDAALVVSLNREVQDLHAEAHPWFFKHDASFVESEASALLSREDALVFIAEREGDAIGYAYAHEMHFPENPFRYAYSALLLEHIGERTSARGEGAGGALVRAVIDCAKAKGIGLVLLDVWAFNESARVFFEKAGFERYNEKMWMRL